MTRLRDTQRTAVYEAESLVRKMFDRADERGLRVVELAGSQVTLPAERRFASIDSVQAYVDSVLALNWVRARWSRASVRVRVRARAGHAAAHYESDCATIALPEHRANTAWAFRELVVLHELAHHLDASDPDDPAEPPHGPAFVDRFLTLVGEIIGPEAAFALRACGFAACE
ncbi:TIGR04338 family metallohydrolase [Rhodococcus aetherivorans]|uniref:TIGR04338 family metallohydrolase n=1 Tax=Rhodococcus TaxID=1827 RepID=UPI000C9C8001|nr:MULTISPECIES: TIGR04338 family metallohydrolase [Rhodococcus]PND50131.1 TIGR04338 family metallohydrolase [Rhodococcus sp. ENV425]WKW98646.1 TIGR04338 family metallohydrolase [Rhodococcus aetherivorans]